MKVLVLAGGSDQIALICELKSRGHETILVDYFVYPPAGPFADKHIVASTLDVERVKEIAVEEEVDLITTACTDQALLTVANVSEQLGLPCYLSYQTALNVTNKSHMKEVLWKNTIPTARFTIYNSADIISTKGLSMPVVVKPVDCNSSKGVRRVDKEEDLPRYLEEAIRLSRTGEAIVEEFKTGKELSVDYWVEGTTAKFLSATESLKIKNRNSFTILCSNYPAVDLEQEADLQRIGNQIASAFGLKNCPLFVQMTVNGKDVNVIEFSARMGGGSKYNLIRVLSGVDIMSKYVDLITGNIPSVNPRWQVAFAKMVYIYCNPGILDHLEGFEELKAEHVIDEYFQYKMPGIEITKSETSGDRPAGFLITARSSEELHSKLCRVDSSVRVVSIEGKDIMIHNLLT